ncbi:AraC family transcriptional regulator [Thalassolituus pacificus]|uniref:AraC family transcriptional regulator n=1 Tax=Thalassolituus pacificus TaxID=2975440 RepID=A0A9X3AGF2_9GAMM|nr:AraC family transcriptional regulator [Thalassolituus pacificus]MCT7358516.1 AraC family transcriptional regulator [Thalassolituus pacificus]
MTMYCGRWYERDERFIAAHHQPALLLDLLLARDISSHKILRGSGLFYEDILTGSHYLSPAQLQQLITNGRKLLPQEDLSFRWGDSLWPGHYGVFSQLLANAPDLERALQALVDYRRFLSPLLVPRIYQDERYCYVQWLDACGLQDERRFMVETAMTGLTAMSRWLAQETLPWRYGFSYAQPAQDEQYQVYLGPDLHFSVGVDVMMIEKHWLQKAWPRGSATAYQVALREAQLLIGEDVAMNGFNEAVYHYLTQQLRAPQSLPEVAQAFAMSPATFKRKLHKHHCHFQQLQDQARLHVCLYLFHINGWTNEQVAHYLNFNDTTNFRRAFKRWSGLTPSDSKQRFLFAAG